MPRTVSFKGTPLELVGRPIKEGQRAPDARLVSPDLKEVGLLAIKDGVRVVTSFPSLDTPVCDLQVKEFNKEATRLAAGVSVIGVSKDLPFAQKRFCETFSIQNVTLLSDYKTSSFGINYGLLIKELNLLARAVLIIDRAGILRYVQVVPELASPPDYRHALGRLAEIVAAPVQVAQDAQVPLRCKPCEGGIAALAPEEIERSLARHRGWELVEAKKLVREFTFADFAQAKYFLDLVAVLAQEQGHHPTMVLSFHRLKVTLSTRAAGGLTENDFIMARLIDELAAGVSV